LVLATAVIVFTAAGCSRSPRQAAVDSIDDLLKQNRLSSALEHTEASLQQYPGDVDFLRLRGLILLKAERFDQARAALSSLPADDPIMTKALHHTDPQIRAGAARLTVEYSLPVASAVLRSHVDDANPVVRVYCARALGQIRERSSIRPLYRLLNDDNWQVRAAAATALGKTRNPRAAGWLVRTLEDGDDYVRLAAATALRELADNENRDLLMQVFARATGERQIQLAIALAKLGEKSALGPLTNAIASPDTALRRRVVEALGDYKVSTVTNALALALTDRDLSVRDEAARSLKRLLGKPTAD
jgi:HEAT repeat protein